jgi:hypothetical protein
MMLALALLGLDGMPLRDGRFTGGPVTVLALSEDQMRSLDADRELILSRAQQAALWRAARAAPRTLRIYDTRVGENDCTCGAESRGLRFDQARIEVPHRYLPKHEPPSFADGLMLALFVLPLVGMAVRRVRSA